MIVSNLIHDYCFTKTGLIKPLPTMLTIVLQGIVDFLNAGDVNILNNKKKSETYKISKKKT